MAIRGSARLFHRPCGHFALLTIQAGDGLLCPNFRDILSALAPAGVIRRVGFGRIGTRAIVGPDGPQQG